MKMKEVSLNATKCRKKNRPQRDIVFIVVCFIWFICIPMHVCATDDILESQRESLNINGFINEANKYTKEIFEDIDFGEFLNETIKGNVDNTTIIHKILGLFGEEIIQTIKIMGSIIIVIVVHSILKSVTDNLENKGVSQITYYVQYILIVTLVMLNFSDIVNLVKDTISNLVGFSYTLLPILTTLMITTGSIASANIMQPILLFLITFIGNIITTIIIPIVLVSTALSIVSKVSDKVQIGKLSKFFNSSVVWVLGIILTVFVGLLSVEGTLSSSVDGVTAKTAKAAVSNFVPVVGKILGDAVDTVIGCGNILKNAVGIVGVVVIIGICILPIIKLTILMATYYLASAVCEPIADEKVVSLLSKIGDTFKLLLAILMSVSMMLIIGVTLVVKITNSGLMYR